LTPSFQGRFVKLLFFRW